MAAVVFIVIDLVALYLWVQFLKGSQVARTVLAVFIILHIIFFLLGIASAPVLASIIGFGLGAIFEIILLVLMFAGERTKAYFAAS